MLHATLHEIMYAAQAYILHLIGGTLMPDKFESRVHLMYLKLLPDFEMVGGIIGGSLLSGNVQVD